MDEKRSMVPVMREHERSFGQVLRTCLLSVLFFALSCAVLLLLGTAFAYSRPDPNAWIRAVSYAVPALSALIAGFFCARRNRERILLGGTVTGLLCLALLLLLALLLPMSRGTAYDGWEKIAARLGVFFLTIFGSLLGGRQKAPKRHRVPKHYR